MDCVNHSSTIHSAIVDTDNETITLQLGQTWVFSMMVNVGDGFFYIVHNETPCVANVVIKKSSKSKAIVGIFDKGQPAEAKDLQ